MSIRILGALVLGLSLLATRASAEDAAYERGQGTGITLGLKLGGGFSQPFGDLGTSFLTELEVGYTLPVAKRSFAVFLSGAYTQPGAEGKDLKDDRLPGPASYELTQQELMLTLGLTYRLHLPTELVRPYASLGPRLFLMRTLVKGSAGGEAFGENDETATDIGVFGALGAELHIGPGAALFELSMTWAKIDGYVLRDTSAGALSVGVGYRLFL
ncbi:MAG TPA: outer membrane beta-barrel protein [Polyangiales bacterium]|nr:outer membrane beta-barrel protein [Polyangiales bacterium]